MPNTNNLWLKRCFNCMEPINAPSARCSSCGWDNHNRKNGNAALEQRILKEQYIIGKTLGRGGFGIAYVGFDLVLERRVAIKEFFPIGIAYRSGDAVTVRPYSEEEEDYQSGLKQAFQESRTIAKLGQISNVMQVYNAFPENGTVYIVMEYIDGNSLSKEVKQKGRLSWKEALHLLYPIMDALEKIHDKGLIHRDISPQNIIRRRKTGESVLLDFGSARPPRRGVTVMIKAGYSPIEQYSWNTKQDGRLDEYAICATMYYLLTGTKPLPANLRQFDRKELKRPKEYAYDVPSGIEKVLLKGMAQNSKDRYPSIRGLHEAFLKAEQGEKHGSIKKSAVAIAAAAAGLVCLGGLLFVNTGQNGDPGKEVFDDSAAESEEEEKTVKVTTERTLSSETTSTPTSEPTSTPTPEPTVTQTPEPTSAITQVVPKNLASEELPKMRSDSLITDYIFGSEYYRGKITDVKIGKSLADAPENAWDISEVGDGSVLAWVTIMGEEETLTIAGDGGVRAPEDSSGLFREYYNLRSIELDGFDTSNVTSMRDMFRGCGRLKSLDMSGFDTSNVTDMNSMFTGCGRLESIDISSFSTSNVSDMGQMFDGCRSLTSIDASHFDTSKVEDMNSLFNSCNSLTSIDVSNFSTSNVTNMRWMFSYCSVLMSLDVSNFDTSNVTAMAYMFAGCKNLKSIDVRNFDTSNVTDMSFMFEDCENLTSIGVSYFDTANADTTDMYHRCFSLGIQ